MSLYVVLFLVKYLTFKWRYYCFKIGILLHTSDTKRVAFGCWGQNACPWVSCPSLNLSWNIARSTLKSFLTKICMTYYSHIFVCKVNIWNTNGARTTAFKFDTRTGNVTVPNSVTLLDVSYETVYSCHRGIFFKWHANYTYIKLIKSIFFPFLQQDLNVSYETSISIFVLNKHW